MPQFLLELFSEEIPARMQKRGADDLKKLLMDALSKAGFMPTGIETFSAPRRLTAVVEGLPERTADVSEERKGPKVGAPEQALAGFLRGAGLTDIAQARVVEDAKKGDYYVADIVKAGIATPDAIAAIIPDIVRNFPWPKSMRWGEGTLRWVRPLHRMVAAFDGQIVPFEIDGIVSGNITEGHRFHGIGTFTVRDYDDYAAKLSAAHVVLDREERKQTIAADARTLCEARNLELVDDIGLLEEVCGLVDEPHVIMGDMDPAFLDLPPEVIRLTLRVNQKYFVVRDPKTGALAPHFIVISNVAATDGGKLIALGNARVLAARLNDARYFWDLDRKSSLESRVPKLNTLVFHEKLGSVGDKVQRIVELAGQIAPLVGADVETARRAALLCKADLTTEMVGEFPELQGVMGRYYAQHAGEPANIVDSMRDHYKPVGPSDTVPTEPVAVAVALADKLDSLVGFFAIGEKPTGAGDPFALRRAALGVIRIVRERGLHISLTKLANTQAERLYNQFMTRYIAVATPDPVIGTTTRFSFLSGGAGPKKVMPSGAIAYRDFDGWVFFDESDLKIEADDARIPDYTYFWQLSRQYVSSDDLANLLVDEKSLLRLLPRAKFLSTQVAEFILDRLRVTLRDEGFAPDILEAAFAIQDDDINRIVARVTALSTFLKTEDGKNLSAGYKRASNILKAEDKKGALPDTFVIDAKALELKQEMALNDALAHVQAQLPALLEAEDFDGAMTALSTLRGPVDAFFEDVLVNDPDPAKRLNRLAMLVALRDATLQVADFEKIAG